MVSSNYHFDQLHFHTRARESIYKACRFYPNKEVELIPYQIRALAQESNNRDFKVQCPVMESNFGLFVFEPW
jgi:hypothetical protein